jgi:hypothetical protein
MLVQYRPGIHLVKYYQKNFSGFARILGPRLISELQDKWGARLYFNTLIPFESGLIKYGVISRWKNVLEKLRTSPGTDVMIFKILSLKNSAKKMAFLTQNKAKLYKILIITLVFEKNSNFFAENCQKSQKIVITTSTPGQRSHHFKDS